MRRVASPLSRPCFHYLSDDVKLKISFTRSDVRPVVIIACSWAIPPLLFESTELN